MLPPIYAMNAKEASLGISPKLVLKSFYRTTTMERFFREKATQEKAQHTEPVGKNKLRVGALSITRGPQREICASLVRLIYNRGMVGVPEYYQQPPRHVCRTVLRLKPLCH